MIRRCSSGEFISSTKSKNDARRMRSPPNGPVRAARPPSLRGCYIKERRKGQKCRGPVGYAKTLEMLEKCQRLKT